MTENGHGFLMLTLSITGFSAHPQIVSDILQLEPTSTVIRGQVSTSKRPHMFNGWWLDVHPEPLKDGAEHGFALSTIIDRLREREAAFQRLKEEVQPDRITLYGAIYFRVGNQCGIWLEAPDMMVLAACGIGWGLDLFAEEEHP